MIGGEQRTADGLLSFRAIRPCTGELGDLDGISDARHALTSGPFAPSEAKSLRADIARIAASAVE